MQTLDPDQPIRRLPHVIVRSVDDAAFLVDEQSESIYHLNPLGAALWNLLVAPHSINEASEVVHAAFPKVARERIVADIRTLFLDLLDSGLAELA